jgi:hypothetical protein
MSRVTPAHPSDAGESNANLGGVEHTMPHAAADSDSPQESVNPSVATTSPQATLPTNASNTPATRLAKNNAATVRGRPNCIYTANQCIKLSLILRLFGVVVMVLAGTSCNPLTATPIPAAPAKTSVAASNVDPTAAATSPPVCANNRLTDGALHDAVDVISANGAATPVVEANVALDAALAASTASEVMEESAPTIHPGITVVHPTPDNSQDTAATHTMLIPPSAINPPGMVMRSKSRSLTPVLQSPMSLPVPQPPAESSSSKPKSTGSS